MSVTFTGASGSPAGYLVLFQSGSSPTVPPADGTNYTVGDNLGSGKVAYVGSATNFSISSLSPATIYYFDVYAYNGTTGTYNYLGTSPLEGSKSTLELPPANQTSSVTVAGITTTTNSVSYLSSGSANYLVLRYTDAAPSQLPANGTAYPALTTLGNSTVVYSGNALGLNDSGLSAGTGYKYAVLSYNGSGESSHYLTTITAQNSTSFITLPAAPVATPASSVGNTSFIANWNPVTGGFTYELEVSSDDFVSLLSGFPKTAITAFEYTVTGLITNTTYKYRVKAANANGGLSAFSNTVTVATNSTSNPLKINTTPTSATLLSGFGSAKLTVNVSGGSGTKSVKLQYRKITDAAFTPLPCTLKSSDDYEVTVTESMLDELGMEYYFEATDGGGASVSQSAHSYLYYRITQGSANSSIPFASGFNGQSSSYKMFSIPYVLDDKNFESIFDEMGAYNKEVWRLFRFDPASESYKEFAAGLSNNIESGKSYWFNAASDLKEPIQVGAGTVAQANQFTPLTLQLSPGWNQIGNPYPFNVDWAAIQSLNASVGLNSLWLFEGGGYVKKNVLAAWKGAFVYADNGGTVTFPVTSRTTSPGRITANDLSLDIDEDAWQLPLTLTHQDMIHSGAIGMHPLATESKDRFDEITVPRFIDYLEMYTSHPEYRSSKFSSDIIPSTSSRTWQFNLTSNQEEGSATLAWDHLTLGKGQSHIMLIDHTDQVWLDMKKVGHYSFTWKNDRQVTLLYARQGDIDPGITLLGLAYPNPFADQVSFPLLIDADHRDAVVEIYDLMGRKIRSLHHAFPSAGVYEIQWDGKDYSGQEVASGMLIYRLAGSTQSKRIVKQ